MPARVEPTPAAKGAVVVGGVGEGLGFAVSSRFAAAGHPVVMFARSAENLEPLSRKIHDQGGTAVGRFAAAKAVNSAPPRIATRWPR